MLPDLIGEPPGTRDRRVIPDVAIHKGGRSFSRLPMSIRAISSTPTTLGLLIFTMDRSNNSQRQVAGGVDQEGQRVFANSECALG